MTGIEAVGMASVSTASRLISGSMPRKTVSPHMTAGITILRAMTATPTLRLKVTRKFRTETGDCRAI
jgi:hypothetical protein